MNGHVRGMSESSPQYFLEELKIQNFRSFGPESCLTFRRGLNVLVGANGAGKSNALDAVLFAMGQDKTQIRLCSWTELTNRTRRGPCAVSVRLSKGSDKTEDLSLMAMVKDESSRVLRLNGAMVNLQNLRQSLLHEGIDVESPYLCIRQRAASTLLQSGELSAILQQASGATHFHTVVADSRSRLDKEKAVLTRVKSDMAVIQEVLGKDREAMKDLDAMQNLHDRVRHAKLLACDLNRRLNDVMEAARADEASEANRRAQACASESERLRVEIKTAVENAQAQADEAKAKDAAAAAAAQVVSEITHQAGDAETSLVHACVQEAVTKQQQLMHKAVLLEEETGGGNCERQEQLRGRLLALRQESLTAEEAFLQLGSWGMEHDKNASDALDQGAYMKAEKGRPDLGELVAWAERSKSAASQAFNECEKAEENGLKLLGEATAKLKESEMHAKKMESELKLLSSKRDKIEEDLGMTSVALTSAELSSLKESLATAEKVAARADLDAEKADDPLRSYVDDNGDVTLCSLINLDISHGKLEECLDALQEKAESSAVLAGRHLGVRITDTVEQALLLIQMAGRLGKPVRVWPLERLLQSGHSEEHYRLEALYPNRVIAPLSLIKFKPEHRRAMENAFGRYVIVDNDELGSEIVAKHRCPCVTFSGNQHEIGRLLGGYRGLQPSVFRNLLIRQRAIEESRRAHASAAEARGRARAASERMDLTNALHDAASEEHVVQQRLKKLTERMNDQQAKLSAIEAEVACLSQQRKCLQARITRLTTELGFLKTKTIDQTEGGDEEKTAILKVAESRSRAIKTLNLQIQWVDENLSRTFKETLCCMPILQVHDEEAKTLAEQIEDQHRGATAAKRELKQLEIKLVAATRNAMEAQNIALASSASSRAADKKLSAMNAAFTDAEHEAHCAFANLQNDLWDGSTDQSSRGRPAWIEHGDDDQYLDHGGIRLEKMRSDEVFVPCASLNDLLGVTDVQCVLADLDPKKKVDKLQELMSELELAVHIDRRKLSELEGRQGKLSDLRERLQEASGCSRRMSTFSQLQQKEETVTKSISVLMKGIQEMQTCVAQANMEAFEAIREGCMQNFVALVPSMELDIQLVNESPLDSFDVHFWIRNNVVDGMALESNTISKSQNGRGRCWRRGLEELSGGQLTLLNISLLLAVAKYRPSSLLLLDEVDAALDEHNASRIASLLEELSNQTQVIAISHRQEFHRLADHIVRLEKIGSFTVVNHE